MHDKYRLNLDEIFIRMLTWANPDTELASNCRRFSAIIIDEILNTIGDDEVFYILDNQRFSDIKVKERLECSHAGRIIDLSRYISKAGLLRETPIQEINRQTRRDYLNLIKDLQIGANAQPTLLYLSSIVPESMVPINSPLRCFSEKNIPVVEGYNEKIRNYANGIIRKEREQLMIAYEDKIKMQMQEFASFLEDRETQNSSAK